MGSSRLFSHLSTKPSAARKMLLPFELLCLQGSPEASLARATCVSGSSPAEPLAVGLLLGGAWEHQEGSATEQDQGQEMDSVTRRLTGKDAWCLLVLAPLPQPCEALTGLHLPLVTSPRLFLSCLAPAPRSPQPRPHGLQLLPGTGLSSPPGQALGRHWGVWGAAGNTAVTKEDQVLLGLGVQARSVTLTPVVDVKLKCVAGAGQLCNAYLLFHIHVFVLFMDVPINVAIFLHPRLVPGLCWGCRAEGGIVPCAVLEGPLVGQMKARQIPCKPLW